MNRQRFVDRTFHDEGSQRAQQLGIALSGIADSAFIESIIHLKSALDEYGGQGFIAATRGRFSWVPSDEDGMAELVPDKDGPFLTLGYIVHYGSKPTLKRLDTEEEVEPVEAPDEPEDEAPFDGEVEEEQEPVTSG